MTHEKAEVARGWKLTRSEKRARRNRRLALVGAMAAEHSDRQRGWRPGLDGRVELWFSSCNNDEHGTYAPTCQWCNLGEWTPTRARVPEGVA